MTISLAAFRSEVTSELRLLDNPLSKDVFYEGLEPTFHVSGTMVGPLLLPANMSRRLFSRRTTQTVKTGASVGGKAILLSSVARELWQNLGVIPPLGIALFTSISQSFTCLFEPITAQRYLI